jgi:hypothetical protein
MPSLEEHCKHSKDRYGVEGRDIHSWMDEPVVKFMGSHRQYRHNKEAIEAVKDIFGEKYGRRLAGDIATDHIDFDKKESNRKSKEKHDAITAKKEPYGLKNPEYEEKKEKERRDKRISEIKTVGIKNYVQNKYAPIRRNKKGEIITGLFDLAIASFLDWEKYCLSQKPPDSKIERKDMTSYFIDIRNRVGARTASHYLGFLVPYLKHEKLEDLAVDANNKKKEYSAEVRRADKNSKLIPVKDVVKLYKSVPLLRDKVLIRLLLFQNDIPIKDLDKISFIQLSKGKYQFNIKGTIIPNINEETIKLAGPLIQENIEKGDSTLLGIAERTIEINIHDYGERANLSYEVTPNALRKFGVVIRQIYIDEFMEMLRE